MDSNLNQKYINVDFPNEVIEMFIDIINSDKNMRKIFLFIGSTIQKRSKDINSIHHGVTISDITSNVKVNRREKVEKGRSIKFEKVLKEIDRKAAEKYIDKLLSMSLLYYSHIPPYKIFYLTNRGKKVLLKLIEAEGDGHNE